MSYFYVAVRLWGKWWLAKCSLLLCTFDLHAEKCAVNVDDRWIIVHYLLDTLKVFNSHLQFFLQVLLMTQYKRQEVNLPHSDSTFGRQNDDADNKWDRNIFLIPIADATMRCIILFSVMLAFHFGWIQNPVVYTDTWVLHDMLRNTRLCWWVNSGCGCSYVSHSSGLVGLFALVSTGDSSWISSLLHLEVSLLSAFNIRFLLAALCNIFVPPVEQYWCNTGVDWGVSTGCFYNYFF